MRKVAPAGATPQKPAEKTTVPTVPTRTGTAPPAKAAPKKEAVSLARLSTTELRKLVEERERELNGAQEALREAQGRLGGQDELLKALEGRVQSLGEQLAEETRSKSELQRRCEAYAAKLEAMGVDPIALETVQPDANQQAQIGRESELMAAQLKELNAKLQLSHETLQSNITRMTGILSALNVGASEFSDLLDEDGDETDE